VAPPFRKNGAVLAVSITRVPRENLAASTSLLVVRRSIITNASQRLNGRCQLCGQGHQTSACPNKCAWMRGRAGKGGKCEFVNSQCLQVQGVVNKKLDHPRRILQQVSVSFLPTQSLTPSVKSQLQTGACFPALSLLLGLPCMKTNTPAIAASLAA
jgi:hypothetical protein